MYVSDGLSSPGRCEGAISHHSVSGNYVEGSNSIKIETKYHLEGLPPS